MHGTMNITLVLILKVVVHRSISITERETQHTVISSKISSSNAYQNFTS